jgi:hypothetical protein
VRGFDQEGFSLVKLNPPGPLAMGDASPRALASDKQQRQDVTLKAYPRDKTEGVLYLDPNPHTESWETLRGNLSSGFRGYGLCAV